MTYTAQQQAHYWRRGTDEEGRWEGDGRPPGEDLAALRRGIGREPGSVPQMWPFYTRLNPEGRLTRELRAEHVALTLFATHQQSRPTPMHRRGVGVGTALRHLRDHGKFSAAAVDRRFAAAATATSLAEAAAHLRGLISQLRGIDQPLDYTRLFWDLRDLQDPESLPAVRRRWGAQYFSHAIGSEAPAAADPAAATTT